MPNDGVYGQIGALVVAVYATNALPKGISEECRASIERMLITQGDPRVIQDSARVSWRLNQGKEMTKRPRTDGDNDDGSNTQ